MLSCWLLSAALAAPAPASDPVPQAKGPGPQAKGPEPQAKGPGWETKLYAQPRVGGLLFSDGERTATGVSIGAEGGLRYWQVGRPRPVLRGVARVAGDYVLTTSDAAGMELRVGNQLGPYWKNVGLQTGPDLFWNRYSFGQVDLDPTVGLAWPLTALAWTRGLSVYGGAEPAWLSNPDRRVDWSEQAVPGFGHEFTWLGGVGVDVGGLSLSLGYRYRITAGGGQHGVSAGISL
ncbi:hypothetical protein L6R53_18665 [Myxococcota bacterium]|nr:hypothetical protein [Myxococcota bacterium]